MRSSTTFQKGHAKIGGFGKGDSQSEQSKKKISQSLYGKRGKLARRWRGDAAGYTAVHVWVAKRLGKADRCGNLDCPALPAARYEWASISGECKRELTDFVSLCTPCHRKYDNGNLAIRTVESVFRREKFIICTNCNHKNVL